jgi:hypothetical protein
MFRCDGGPAIAGALGGVFAITTNPSGDIYATVRNNEIVVKITLDGVLSVIARRRPEESLPPRRFWWTRVASLRTASLPAIRFRS